MTSTNKTKYLKIALALAGVVVSEQGSEIIWRTYEKIQEKGGSFDIGDAVYIEYTVTRKISKKKVETQIKLCKKKLKSGKTI